MLRNGKTFSAPAEGKRHMRLQRMRRLLAVSAAGAILTTTGIAFAETASAETFDCSNGLCNTLHTWGNGSVSDLWTRTNSDYYQALANMQSGGGPNSGVAARAQCYNGTAWGVWIQSTIRVTDNAHSSHIDCENAGYNGIIGNGAQHY